MSLARRRIQHMVHSPGVTMSFQVSEKEAKETSCASFARADASWSQEIGIMILGRQLDQGSRNDTWVWLKISRAGLRRFWSMFPLARVLFWYPFFEPQPHHQATGFTRESFKSVGKGDVETGSNVSLKGPCCARLHKERDALQQGKVIAAFARGANCLSSPANWHGTQITVPTRRFLYK